VHSLPLQTAAELGVVGLALLLAWFAGIALATRDTARRSPEAAGLVAGCVVWATHAALDWDFQMPAATLPAVLLAGALLAQSASATSGASRRNTQTANAQTAA
jgi:O-antigen ligase